MYADKYAVNAGVNGKSAQQAQIIEKSNTGNFDPLKDTYPNLSLGTYTHFADNIHFYEQHFELADKIKINGMEDTQYEMQIENPLIEYKNGSIQLTREGIEFFLTVNNTIANPDSKQRDYNNILSDYLNIRLQNTRNENTNAEIKAI